MLAFGALLTGSIALAQTGSTTPPAFRPLPVTFPITELGGCTGKEACRVYCEDAAHRDACYAYAEAHGLMRAEEIQKARQFIKEHASSTPKMIPGLPLRGNASSSIDAILAEGGGPGGCTTRDACKIFCNDPANSTVCLQFAKDHKLMTEREIELAKKLHSQVGPGGCQGEQCKQYCSDREHSQVCITFARQNGFISKDDADKRLEMMKMSSTTPRLLPINEDGRKIGSTTAPRPDLIKPFKDARGASTTGPNLFKEPQRPPQPQKPPHPTEGSSTNEQSSSIFLAILHFFGL